MKKEMDVTIILDRSGSMQSIRDDTIGGFNAFVDEQKTGDTPTKITLVQFDDEYQVDYAGVLASDVKPLDRESYVPRGSTALLDAVGRTINSIGARLQQLPHEERPEKVCVVIQTDGHENTSKEFSAQQIRTMVKHQEEKYSWNFIFLGADLDAVTVGVNMLGLRSVNSANYSKGNVAATLGAVSRGLTRYKASASSKATDILQRGSNESIEGSVFWEKNDKGTKATSSS